MKACVSLLALALTLSVLPLDASTPEPTYKQTQDWIVSTLTNFGGYIADGTQVTYKDVSLDGCELRFATLRVQTDGSANVETVAVSLNTMKDIIWGTETNPARGYVLFTTTTPMSFSKEGGSTPIGRRLLPSKAATTIGAIEFGRAGVDYAATASQMKTALLRAAEMCKVQVAAN